MQMARVGRPVESQPSCMNSIRSEKGLEVLGFGVFESFSIKSDTSASWAVY